MKPIAIVSGGFDPIHIGHLYMFAEAAQIGELHALVNSNKWLIKKKGRYLLDIDTRLAVLQAMKWVKEAHPFKDDDGGTCINGIKMLAERYPSRRLIFCNGGDRTSNNTPEDEYCFQNGHMLVWNCGGLKMDSSSDILKQWEQAR